MIIDERSEKRVNEQSLMEISKIYKGAKNLESRNKTTKDVCFRMSKD